MLKTDAAFCASGGGEVRAIMERRRWHWECKGGDCEVLVGRRCEGEGRRRSRMWGYEAMVRRVVGGRDGRWDERVAGVFWGLVLAAMAELVLWLFFR